jgi:phage-related protein
MNELDTFEFKPHGDVKITYSWDSEQVNFLNGHLQIHRRRVRAVKTYELTIAGTAETLLELQRFYDKQNGCLGTFYFTYDGIKEVCRFTSKLDTTHKIEVHKTVFFTAKVGLRVIQQAKVYRGENLTPTFNFPYTNEIKETVDWNTKMVTMGAESAMKTYSVPIHTFSFKISGLKEERDKFIDFYNFFGDFTLIKFAYSGQPYKVTMPKSITITDKREGGTIIGYQATIDLTSVNSVKDYQIIRNLFGFVVATPNKFELQERYIFAVGERKQRITVKNPHTFVIAYKKG